MLVNNAGGLLVMWHVCVLNPTCCTPSWRGHPSNSSAWGAVSCALLSWARLRMRKPRLQLCMGCRHCGVVFCCLSLDCRMASCLWWHSADFVARSKDQAWVCVRACICTVLSCPSQALLAVLVFSLSTRQPGSMCMLHAYTHRHCFAAAALVRCCLLSAGLFSPS